MNWNFSLMLACLSDIALNHLHIKKYIHRILKPSKYSLYDTREKSRVLFSGSETQNSPNLPFDCQWHPPVHHRRRLHHTLRLDCLLVVF
jgi:hypothetical protein